MAMFVHANGLALMLKFCVLMPFLEGFLHSSSDR